MRWVWRNVLWRSGLRRHRCFGMGMGWDMGGVESGDVGYDGDDEGASVGRKSAICRVRSVQAETEMESDGVNVGGNISVVVQKWADEIVSVDEVVVEEEERWFVV